MIKIKNNLHFINGEYVASKTSGNIPVYSPSTGEQLGSIPAGCEEDAQYALEVANAAQKSWRKVTARNRAKILRKFAAGIRAQAGGIWSRSAGETRGGPENRQPRHPDHAG